MILFSIYLLIYLFIVKFYGRKKKYIEFGDVGYAWLISFYFYPSSWVFPLDVYSLIIQP